MGETRADDGSDVGTDSQEQEWLSVTDAAARLGIHRGTLYKRVLRGSIQAQKRDGEWYVAVPLPSSNGSDIGGATGGTPSENGHSPVSDDGTDSLGDLGVTLVTSLQSEVAFLREQLLTLTRQLEREQAIVAALTQRVPQLPAAETSTPPASSDDRSAVPWWRRIAFWSS